ncbi:MAG: right-handed parallel beta-helix repeat-containing protein [Deltaproteobacteria bacterium]|nr:right-handed parallel beta-helix repeat-containing protein [Deltaproteobacteria bacterium]
MLSNLRRISGLILLSTMASCGGDDAGTGGGTPAATPKLILTGNLTGLAGHVAAVAVDDTGAETTALAVAPGLFELGVALSHDYVLVLRDTDAGGRTLAILIADQATGRVAFSAGAEARTHALGEVAATPGIGRATVGGALPAPSGSALAGDADQDGIPDLADRHVDEDGDDVRDIDDDFPFQSVAALDSDGDGRPDAFMPGALAAAIAASGLVEDQDDDNDTVADADDAFPLEVAAALDTDGDHMPDSFLPAATPAQVAASGLVEDADDDNDGVADDADAFPIDMVASVDTDADGHPDAFLPTATPEQVAASGLTADLDDDGDGVLDTADLFPTSAVATADPDADGRPDAFLPTATPEQIAASGLTLDNCPGLSNPSQADVAPRNGIGDVCEPAAVADVFSFIAGTAVTTVAAESLLGNDANVGAAVASSGATALGGQVSIRADGTFVYTPPAVTAVPATDTFTYQAQSRALATVAVTATVTMTFNARVWYVDNSATGPGTGTLASPFQTLVAVEAASAAGDTIMVLAGTGNANGQSQGIILKDNQRLLGQGVGFAANLIANGIARGIVLVPPGAQPVIANDGVARVGQPADARGVGVFLANHNEVAGLRIDASAQPSMEQGILGLNTTGVHLHDNTIANINAGFGAIELYDPAGEPPAVANLIVSNTIQSPGRQGILVFNGVSVGAVATAGTVAAVTIDANIVTDSGGDAIELRAAGGDTSALFGVVTNNAVSGAVDAPGIRGLAGDAAGLEAPLLDLTITGNTVTGNGRDGIDLDSQGAASLTALVADNPQVSGNSVPAANSASGISARAVDASTLSVVIEQNPAIAQNGAAGIDVDAQGDAIVRAAIRDNALQNNNTAARPVEFSAQVRTRSPGAFGPSACVQMLRNSGLPAALGFNLQNDAGAFTAEDGGGLTTNSPVPTMNLGAAAVATGTAGACGLP